MGSAWISLCLAALVVAATAEPPSDHGGYGGGKGSSVIATPAHKGVRYAGPIVYTNEKPPMIHFPPPPQQKGGWNGGKGGGGGHSIKYVPLPHHDLPVLIYQSDITPPVHVVGVAPPGGGSHGFESYGTESQKVTYGAPQSSYGPPAGGKAAAPSSSYGAPSQSYGAPAQSYGAPAQTYGAPSKGVKAEYGAPAAISQSYGAPAQSYGAPVQSYGAPSKGVKVEYGAPLAVSQSYGAPSKGVSSQYGAPAVSQSYGAPSKGVSAEYGAPAVSQSYGAPSVSQSYGAPSVSQSYGAPAVSQSYGAPSVSQSYGAPSFSQSYGAPTKGGSSSEYGAPSVSSSYGAPSNGFGGISDSFNDFGSSGKTKGEYGAPVSTSYGAPSKGGFSSFGGSSKKGKKSSPLPHIIYSGHPPIHIFTQPPIYMAAPKIKASYGPPKGDFYGSGSTKTYVKTLPPKGSSFGGKGRQTYSDSLGKGSQSFSSSYGKGKQQHQAGFSDQVPQGSQTYTTTYGKPSTQSFVSGSSSYGSGKPKSKGKVSSSYSSSGSSSYGKGKGPAYSSYESGSSYRSKPKQQHQQKAGGGFMSQLASGLESFRNGFSSLAGGHGHSSGGHSSKGKGHGDLTHSASSYGPPKYSKGPSFKSKGGSKYVPAPASFKKPPIIIYQGVKPPVHVFEKAAPVNTGGWESSSGGYESQYASRRISDDQLTIDMDPRSAKPAQTMQQQFLSMSPSNTMWIPSYGMNQNGYHTALYVSDLTSAGTGGPQLFSAGALGGGNVGSLTQTVQVQNLDGTLSTAQVTSLTSSTGTEGGDVNTKSGLTTNSPAVMATDTDSEPTPGLSHNLQNPFLTATGPNHQNTELDSIPASYSSVIVGDAGAPQ